LGYSVKPAASVLGPEQTAPIIYGMPGLHRLALLAASPFVEAGILLLGSVSIGVAMAFPAAVAAEAWHPAPVRDSACSPAPLALAV